MEGDKLPEAQAKGAEAASTPEEKGKETGDDAATTKEEDATQKRIENSDMGVPTEETEAAVSAMEDEIGKIIAFDKDRTFIAMPLMRAITLMLQYQLDIQSAVEQVKSQEGALRAAAAPFDPTLAAQVGGTFSKNLLSFPTKSRGYSDIRFISGSMNKTTRFGTIYTFNFSYGRNFNGAFTPEWTENYNIGFTIRQPLLRNLMYSQSTVAEMAAEYYLQASYFDLLNQISSNVVFTVNAYWEFAAAKKIRTIYHEATQLERERAKLGITLSLAELASKTQQLDAAELAYYQAMENLKLAMSMVEVNPCADEVFYTPDEFPEPKFSVEQLDNLRCMLLTNSIEERYDIESLILQQKAAGLLLLGSANNLLPDLDIIASVNQFNFDYRTTRDFPRGIGNRGPPQTNWLFGVSFQSPFYNDSAVGSWIQQKAVYESAVINIERGLEQALTDLRTAIANQFALGRQLKEAEETVRAYRLLVEAENQKMKIGFSTLYDLISFENSLTDALVQQVTIIKQYFQNIVLIRHLSATLLIPSDTIDAIQLENLLSL